MVKGEASGHEDAHKAKQRSAALLLKPSERLKEFYLRMKMRRFTFWKVCAGKNVADRLNGVKTGDNRPVRSLLQ